jgi:hypothetical protein
MTTKQADLSRRSVLGGSLAALAASPAFAMAQGKDDSALLAMGQEWRVAWGRLKTLFLLNTCCEFWHNCGVEYQQITNHRWGTTCLSIVRSC